MHGSGVVKHIESFLDSLADRNLSAGTVQTRRTALQCFLRYMSEQGLSRFQDVTAERWGAFRRYMQAAGMTVHSIETYLSSARLFFDYLEANSILFTNPARDTTVRSGALPLPKIISPGEVNRLLNAADGADPVGLRDRAMLETLYSTGIRRQELVGLRVQDPDPGSATVRIRGKGRKERVLPLGKHAVAALEAYLRDGRPKLLDAEGAVRDELWLQRNHRPLGRAMFPVVLRKYVEKAGLEPGTTAHTLRRSCATHMLANGAHPVTVADMLGHADLTSLGRYLRVSIRELKRTHRRSNPGK